MSVFKDKRSPYWRFDFEHRGHRFFGSTKATTRRAAEGVERVEREKAKARVAQQEAARSSLRLDDIAGRYMSEVGQHHAAAANTYKLLERLIEFFGKDKVITEISGDDVARLVAWRRGHRVERGGKRGELIGPFTVNDTTEQLKKLFTRAKIWGVASIASRCGRTIGSGSLKSAFASWSATRPRGSARRRATITCRSLASPMPPDFGSTNACSGGQRSIGARAGSSRSARAGSG